MIVFHQIFHVKINHLLSLLSYVIHLTIPYFTTLSGAGVLDLLFHSQLTAFYMNLRI